VSTVAALDIGGSHVSAARVDVRSRATERGTSARTSYRPDADRDELLDAIVGAAASVATGVELLGVAAPGPFDYTRGVCEVTGLGKLESLYGVNLGRTVSAAIGDGVKIFFVNDAEAFLLGEAWTGAARGHGRAVGITVGTGLGSAFLADGRIVADGPSVPPEGNLHRVPFRGKPVEDAISSRGLLCRHGAGRGAVAGLAEDARAGVPNAVRVFEQLGDDLGEFVAPWLRSFGASCLVVGGSIANAWNLFAGTLQRSLAPVPGVEVIARAADIDDAPLLGAALDAATRVGHLSLRSELGVG
jgi:glucokinase